MREIDGYGGAEFGPFSMYLKGGDPNDLPVNAVLDVVDRWTEMVRDRPITPGLFSYLRDETVEDSYGNQYVIAAPTLQDVRDQKIYIHVVKARAPQPINLNIKIKFGAFKSEHRMADEKKWWKRFLG